MCGRAAPAQGSRFRGPRHPRCWRPLIKAPCLPPPNFPRRVRLATRCLRAHKGGRVLHSSRWGPAAWMGARPARGGGCTENSTFLHRDFCILQAWPRVGQTGARQTRFGHGPSPMASAPRNQGSPPGLPTQPKARWAAPRDTPLAGWGARQTLELTRPHEASSENTLVGARPGCGPWAVACPGWHASGAPEGANKT